MLPQHLPRTHTQSPERMEGVGAAAAHCGLARAPTSRMAAAHAPQAAGTRFAELPRKWGVLPRGL
jgi:hypothetical protein